MKKSLKKLGLLFALGLFMFAAPLGIKAQGDVHIFEVDENPGKTGRKLVDETHNNLRLVGCIDEVGSCAATIVIEDEKIIEGN